MDCANGAGYKAGPKLLNNLGAKVVSIGVKPNGFNINDKCGSTYPSKIQSTVRKYKADVWHFHSMVMLTELLCVMKMAKL